MKRTFCLLAMAFVSVSASAAGSGGTASSKQVYSHCVNNSEESYGTENDGLSTDEMCGKLSRKADLFIVKGALELCPENALYCLQEVDGAYFDQRAIDACLSKSSADRCRASLKNMMFTTEQIQDCGASDYPSLCFSEVGVAQDGSDAEIEIVDAKESDILNQDELDALCDGMTGFSNLTKIACLDFIDSNPSVSRGGAKSCTEPMANQFNSELKLKCLQEVNGVYFEEAAVNACLANTGNSAECKEVLKGKKIDERRISACTEGFGQTISCFKKVGEKGQVANSTVTYKRKTLRLPKFKRRDKKNQEVVVVAKTKRAEKRKKLQNEPRFCQIVRNKKVLSERYPRSLFNTYIKNISETVRKDGKKNCVRASIDGKRNSSLVMHDGEILKNNLSEDDAAYFTSGKFDQNCRVLKCVPVK